MKILVNYVAAEDGGGLFVLKDFYKDVLKFSPEGWEWVFFVSSNAIESTDNVRVVVFDDLKKSHLTRLAFDFTKLQGLVNNYKPDVVVSLQNMPIKGIGQPQYVYLHQSLQYCPVKFSLLKGDERALAIRQRFICGMYRKLLPKAEHIFVQTEWMKAATEKWIDYPKDKISVVPVNLDVSSAPIKKYTGYKSRVFFYPARAEKYKNHAVIIKAAEKLASMGVKDYKIIFTFDGNANAYSSELYQMAQGLPIEFAGTVPYEKMWEYYAGSILLFPSYLETCGIPLLEARAADAKIIASDMPFSHEALEGYSNAEFFAFDNADELAAKMLDCLNNEEYEMAFAGDVPLQTSLMKEIVNLIEKKQ